MTKKTTTFQIEYYKTSGKLYSSDSFQAEVTWIADGSPNGIPYMADATALVRVWRITGARMPGLSGCWREGPIRVDHPDGLPCLIL